MLVEGGAPCDPTAPGKGVGDVDPNEPAFTVRLVVTDSAGNRGEDRKVMFAYREPDAHEGSSRPIGRERDATGEADSGGEASQRMYDLDGDNDLEIVEATSSGELYVFKEDGTPLQSFNGGEPVLTQTYGNVRAGAPFYQGVEPPREALRTPAIGDIDGDLEPEIVDTAGERIYAWEADGGVVDGFPFRTDPSLSRPEDRTKANHVKPGFIGSPVLGNLDEDPELEIVAAALDQHLYGLDGDGRELPGFPVYLRERDADGTPLPCTGDFECAESINTPAIGDMNADGEPEIVIATNEFADNPDTPGIPDSGDLTGLPGTLVTLLTANLLGGEGRTYAVDRNGEILDGWPVKTPGTLPDALPLIGPGHDYVLGDIDGEPGAEAIGAVTTGELQAFDFSGASAATFPSIPQVGETPLALKTLSFFEYPILADLDTTLGDGPEVAKAGISLTGLLNVGVTTGLNLPYNHLMQAWSTTAGGNPVLLPAYPQPIEDYQLLSSPAAADVSDADGVELLAGTGMYLIRNLNSAGVEGSGWPKFTGGWAFAVPATGDVDRDGMLEVSVMTREGFSFLWDTHRPACTEDGGDNQQWWTSRHDEWSTGAYETDSRPPGVPEDLAAVREPDGSVTLSWTAPGDDWLCGQAARVRVLGAEEPLERAVDGLELTTVDADAGAGEKTSLSLSAEEVDGVTDAAVTYRDDVGNWGRIATVEIPPVPSTDPPDPSDPPDPAPADCDNPRRGSAGSDFFVGGPDSDGYRGRGGGDELRGKGGSDCLWGGAKADELAGARGDDLIKGGRGIDDLRSGPGNDRVRGGRGGDTIRGGGGEDDLRSQRGHDTLRGGGGDDLLRGGKGRDRVRGGGGDDRINVKGGGRDVVNCGKGDDTVRAGSRDRVLGNCERVRRGRSG